MKKKNLLVTAIAIFGLATITMAQTVPSYVPTNGLVSWYPFNGNANDSSGNGKNGTIYGGVSLTTDRFGNPNNSYNFNGTTGAILADTFYVSNNFTASFWYLASSSINLSASNNENSGSTILCKGASNSPCNYADFAFGFKNGYYGIGEQNCTSNSWLETELGWGCNYTYVSNCNSNISLQYNWTNLTIVLSSGYLKRYSNGVLIDSITYTAHSGLLANSGYPLSIGGRYVANCGQGGSCIFNFWKGKLDDIGIWNRALTQLEISALYTVCSATVTTQPINQSVNISNNAQFTTASSDPLATYQWQTDLGFGYISFNSIGQYSGTANDTLTIANTTLTNNNQPFRCIISSGSCTDTSAVAVLTVLCNISVTTQPINQSVNISNNAQFTTASSDLFATYQWQTDLGVGFQNLNNVGQYSGTINDTLTIANTTLSNNNQPFRCIISSGSCTDTSAVAVLTVLCNISVTTQPINQSVNISNNAQFTTASSDPLATYQWQTDLGVGYLNLNSVGQYSGTINDTLTITNTTLSNNNQPFRCIISSGSCTDTSNVAVLTVINNVGINEFTQDNLFSVYPNPANSHINVKADVTLLGSDYTVYDNTGKLVLSGKINSENTVIELGNLSGGIYMFNVGGNLKQTFKVIKE